MKRPYDSRRWRALRLQIIARDGGCIICGATEELDVDHIISWTAGGSWFDPANLRTLCRLHHNRKPTRGHQARAFAEATSEWEPSTSPHSRDW